MLCRKYLLLVQHVELISGNHTETGVPARTIVGGSVVEGLGVGAVGGGDGTPRIWGERGRREWDREERERKERVG